MLFHHSFFVISQVSYFQQSLNPSAHHIAGFAEHRLNILQYGEKGKNYLLQPNVICIMQS